LVNNSVTVGGQSVALGGSAAVQGNGAKIQLSTGTVVSGNCAKFDANGNVVDNGAACGSGSTGITFTDGTHTVTGSTQLTVTGGTVGGTTPNATLTVSGGSGSLVKIGTATASNSTCLSWGVAVTGCVNGSTTDLSTLGYNTFQITCDSLKPGTASGYWYLHVAEGATPTVETSNYGWQLAFTALTSSGTVANAGGSSTASTNVGIAMANGTLTTTTFSTAGLLNLGASSIPRTFKFNGIAATSATDPSSLYHEEGMGAYVGDQNAITAITLDLYSGANGTQKTGAAGLVSGSCTLYGLVN
jgi:hypothetical protein